MAKLDRIRKEETKKCSIKVSIQRRVAKQEFELRLNTKREIARPRETGIRYSARLWKGR